MANCIDIVGNKYGKLTVIQKSIFRGNRGQVKWDCICECGNNHTVTGESLRHGKSKSCGCLKSGRPPNYKDNREVVLWNRLYSSTIKKRNRGKFNQETNISLAEFINISKQPCFYCGDSFVQSAKDNANGTVITNTLILFNGIDRINSGIGYEIGNVVSCCKHCNTAKNSLTTEQFRSHIEKIYKHFCM